MVMNESDCIQDKIMSNLVCEELAGNNSKVNFIMSNLVCEELAGNNLEVKLIHVFMNLCLEFLKSVEC